MELAALIVAVVAVVISLASAAWSIGWSIWQHRKTTTPQVLVQGSFVLLADVMNGAYEIKGINQGVVPVTLSGAFAELDGASEYVAFFRFVLQSPASLPLVVGPGEVWSGFVQANEFRSAMAGIAGERQPPWRVRVGVGGASRSYSSDWFELSPK